MGPSMEAPAAIIYRRRFEASALEKWQSTAREQKGPIGDHNNLVFICEGSDQLMVVELFLKPSKTSPSMLRPRRSKVPCLQWELFAPSQSLEAVVFGSGRYNEGGSTFSGVDLGWNASDWSLTEDSDPLFVVASYSAPRSELPRLRDIGRRHYERIREKEQRGSLHYQWSFSHGEDGEILFTATELYRDFRGFDDHLKICEDLFSECDGSRSLLGVDVHGSAEALEKCKVFESSFAPAPLRLFRTSCFGAGPILEPSSPTHSKL